jgi:hypothetical protein
MKVCTGRPSTIETGHGLLDALKDGFYIRKKDYEVKKRKNVSTRLVRPWRHWRPSTIETGHGLLDALKDGNGIKKLSGTKF